MRARLPFGEPWIARPGAMPRTYSTRASHIRRSRLLTFLLSFAMIFALTLIWAVATPPMASPDEPAHAMRAAAAALGQLEGTPSTTVPGSADVTVPRYFAEAEEHLNCYRRQILVTPSCVTPVGDPTALVIGHTTAAALNPPLFYVTVGWPATFLDGAKALYAMRALSALVCAALLAVAFTALRRSSWSVLAMAVATTPMVLFLSGTVNPNGMEACAAVAAFALLTTTLRTESTGWILIQRVALITMSSILLINTRSLSLVWLLIIAVVSLLLAKPDVLRSVLRAPATWLGSALIGATAVWALRFSLRPQDLTLTYSPIGAGGSWESGFFTTLDRTFEYGLGWIGHFGWLDTPAPTFTLLIWTLTAGMIILAGLVLGSWRVRTGLILIALVMILLPALLQAALVQDVGYVWQGRYTIALFMVVLVAAGIGLGDSVVFPTAGSPTCRLIVAGAVALGLGQIAAFVWALKRYVVSLSWDLTWIDMLTNPTWLPPGGWIPLGLAYSALIAAGTFLLIAAAASSAQLGEEDRAGEDSAADRESDPGSSPGKA